MVTKTHFFNNNILDTLPDRVEYYFFDLVQIISQPLIRIIITSLFAPAHLRALLIIIYILVCAFHQKTVKLISI